MCNDLVGSRPAKRLILTNGDNGGFDLEPSTFSSSGGRDDLQRQHPLD